ncbi:hypothetical protein FJY94_00765 [Candidatus Kaiserbacteria bacterium]|nr:hypothetical protein [Candidatus Kaiserbacteria bacterium]
MEPTVTIGGAANQTILTLGEALFRWVPAVLASVSGVGAPEGGVAWTGGTAMTSPVTTDQFVTYVKHAPASAQTSGAFDLWAQFVVLSLSMSFVLAAIIVYSLARLAQIRRAEERKFSAAAHPVAAGDVSRVVLRWRRIQEQVGTDNDQGWRLAILEADILLNELLDTLGYKGETMADKMRAVERADFRTIDLAWEAHRARNRIAHEGSAHLLNEREARRIIGMYEQVFREFKFLD